MKKKYINATAEITALNINDVITASLTYVDGNNGSGSEDGDTFLNMFGS